MQAKASKFLLCATEKKKKKKAQLHHRVGGLNSMLGPTRENEKQQQIQVNESSKEPQTEHIIWHCGYACCYSTHYLPKKKLGKKKRGRRRRGLGLNRLDLEME
eukprot:TRINITY_DN2171_c0_g1_i5.p1 TRINITY_DN2171_c0_g1~~TRINITY_DN2171_c0_g1_i5.p1  ORF type:complete len:103 (+),score=8.62 TRINITY_DN2171_c0_g1_i5:90-398(+)